MAKKFAPRVSKKNRKSIEFDESKYRTTDHKLLSDARLDEVKLIDIQVKEQVRTKFNDSSLKELSTNIAANGLIQPLVLHRKNSKLTLICGERRYRAMSLIKMKKCPCFILENKNPQELMAIQFSENSSREELHYIDRADGILNYQKATKASERKITAALGISKSEVHRSLLIAKMTSKIKEAAKTYNIEKYVLLEFSALAAGTFKKKIERQILIGEVVKRSDIKRLIKSGGLIVSKSKTAKKSTLPKGMTANAFLKAMTSRSKTMQLDKKTEKLLKSLVSDTCDMLD